MWLRLTLFLSLLTPALHIVVLAESGQDAVATPIIQLSRVPRGWLHTLGLAAFALAHVTLAAGLARRDAGRFWSVGRALLVAAGVSLVYVAWFFQAANLSDPASANDPLWIVASLIGFAMGALQFGLARQAPGLGLFNALCIAVWLALIPLILLVNESWIGAYERLVGVVYVTWIAGLALTLSVKDRFATDTSA